MDTFRPNVWVEVKLSFEMVSWLPSSCLFAKSLKNDCKTTTHNRNGKKDMKAFFEVVFHIKSSNSDAFFYTEKSLEKTAFDRICWLYSRSVWAVSAKTLHHIESNAPVTTAEPWLAVHFDSLLARPTHWAYIYEGIGSQHCIFDSQQYERSLIWLIS